MTLLLLCQRLQSVFLLYPCHFSSHSMKNAHRPVAAWAHNENHCHTDPVLSWKETHNELLVYVFHPKLAHERKRSKRSGYNLLWFFKILLGGRGVVAFISISNFKSTNCAGCLNEGQFWKTATTWKRSDRIPRKLGPQRRVVCPLLNGSLWPDLPPVGILIYQRHYGERWCRWPCGQSFIT